MLRKSEERYPTYLDCSRYISAFLLMSYGCSKLAHLQFHLNYSLSARPVGSLTGYELTWFYYGYSRTYSIILGLTQVFGGGLLMFRKAAFLGALAMLPVITNILLIDILVLPPDWGPTLPASIIFFSIVLILLRNARHFIPLIWSAQPAEPTTSRGTHWAVRIAIVIILVAMMTTGVLMTRHFSK